MSSSEEMKAIVAKAAVNSVSLTDNMVIGIGSGTTIVYAVKELGEKVKREKRLVRCVPTSAQAKQLILLNGLILSDLEGTAFVDVTIDGADEVDQHLTLIKGGGGCLTREKVIAGASRRLIIIVDESKKSQRLGEKWTKGIPLEVMPMAYEAVRQQIQERLGGTVNLRLSASGKAGPVVTDNGFYLMDWLFPHSLPSEPQDWLNISHQLNGLPGLLENGLFINMKPQVFIAKRDGTVEVQV